MAIGKVKGLVEGVIYEFRVKAVNKAGESEPSDPSLPHRARPKNSAPRIDRNAMMDIKILAGEPLNINVPIDGEPPPMKTWTKDSNVLDESSIISSGLGFEIVYQGPKLLTFSFKPNIEGARPSGIKK
mgnify:CR=1 FL=1